MEAIRILRTIFCARTKPSALPDRNKQRRNRWRFRKKKGKESMEAVSTCEIARLPEDLLLLVISWSCTAPRDACRAAAVSPAFRAAAGSDAVWSRFLPPDLTPPADGELDPATLSKKDLYMRLCPVLFADGLVSTWLDWDSGAKCYMLSARALSIVWSGTPDYWRWIPLTDSRFAEAAKLVDVCWLEIRGKMHCQMLTQNTKYAAYMVFKLDDGNYGLDNPLQDAVVSIGEKRSTLKACLQGYDHEDDEEEVPEGNVQLPHNRADGWMELEMGEFFTEGADHGEVSISLLETRGGHWKRGLIVHGIEIRTKNTIATCNLKKGGELEQHPSTSCPSDGEGEEWSVRDWYHPFSEDLIAMWQRFPTP